MKLSWRIEKELIAEFCLFFAGIALISLLYMESLVLALLLLILWTIGMKFLHSRHDFLFFATAAIVGPVGEMISIYFGAWQYAKPDFFGIPAWLPFVWGLAAVLIKRIAETLIKAEKRK